MGKRYLYILLLIGIFSLQFGCSFGDINNDPERESNANMNEILPSAAVQTYRNILSIGGRVSSIIVQHFEGVDAQPLGYNNYLIDEQTLSDFWESGLYSGAMKDCKLIMDKAEEANQPHYAGIAKVLMAFNLGLATSMWGDVPFSKALQGTASIKSPYDTQEVVYQQIIMLLTEAIVDFETPAVAGGPAVDDLVFRGDISRWLKTTYALRARYKLHLNSKDNTVLPTILDDIAKSFTSRGEQPSFAFLATDNESNPLALFGKERPRQLEIGVGIKAIMDEKSDPRRAKYWVTKQGKNEVFLLDTTILVRTQRVSPLALITYDELLFIEAEVLVRLNQGNASAAFTKGILQSMESLGITSQQYNPYLAFQGGLSSGLTMEQKLEKIVIQKYIALFAQNPFESWTDYRRTGYPKLTIPANSNSSFNPSLIIPFRMLYPISERTTNNDNYKAAIDRQGGHFMDVKPWLFQ